MMDFGLQGGFFLLLGLCIAAVVSAYREESPRAILIGTWKRLLKYTAFTLVMIVGMLVLEWVFLGQTA